MSPPAPSETGALNEAEDAPDSDSGHNEEALKGGRLRAGLGWAGLLVILGSVILTAASDVKPLSECSTVISKTFNAPTGTASKRSSPAEPSVPVAPTPSARPPPDRPPTASATPTAHVTPDTEMRDGLLLHTEKTVETCGQADFLWGPAFILAALGVAMAAPALLRILPPLDLQLGSTRLRTREAATVEKVSIFENAKFDTTEDPT